MKEYDLAIIGSGPAGYVAALYASRHKLSVCLIEKDSAGGTCLNSGCIPTKTLLHTASIVSDIKNSGQFGVEVSGLGVNFQKAVSHKNEVVSRLRSGLETLFRAAGIDLVCGTGTIISPCEVRIEGSGTFKARNIIIATGSKAVGLPGMQVDGSVVMTSDGILNLKELPRSLLVIGGGVIGCEFSTLFNSLGVKVKIVELMDRLIPTMSREISKKLSIILKKRGIEVSTSSRAESLSGFDKILVSVGRAACVEDIGLERIGVKTDKGRIVVDEYLRTAVKNIYAAGDCVPGPQLAHKASYDGILACDNILGNMRKASYINMPNCVWTDPEIASVGMNEEQARAEDPGLRIAKFPYLASGKAYAIGKTEGFIKIMGSSDGSIMGVEIFGAGACELISEAVLAKTAGLNIKDWAKSVHGHPTLSEITQEAIHIFCGTPVHGI